jgi:Peptidase_C39 like family
MERVEDWLLPLPVAAEPTEDELPLVVLPLVPQRQELPQWCWIAIASSMSVFFKGEWGRQCKLAEQLLNQPCCRSPTPGACNQPGSLADAMEAARVLREDTRTRTSFPQFVVEIDQRRPLGVAIIWVTESGGHGVALYGYRQNPDQVLVGDPWFGQSWMKYVAFPSLYQGGGIWVESDYT